MGLGLPGFFPCLEDVFDDLVDAFAVLDPGEDEGAIAAHLRAVSFHDREVGADGLRQVGLVDDQEVGLGNSRPALARNLITARDVDDVDRVVGELPAEVGGEVVAAGLAEEHVGLNLSGELLQRQEVGGDIFADGGVRTAAGLDRLDTLGFEGFVADQELGIFTREDIVGHRGEAEALTQLAAERQQQGCFAAADRSADSNGKGAATVIPLGRRRIAFLKQAGMIHVFMGVPMPGVITGVIMSVLMIVAVRMFAVGVVVGMG